MSSNAHAQAGEAVLAARDDLTEQSGEGPAARQWKPQGERRTQGQGQASVAGPKVMIVLNTAWNLQNFRAGLIRGMIAAGYEVVAVAPPDAYVARVQALGCRFIALPQSNHGTAILTELLLVWRFWRLLRAERPAAYLGYTIKPNTYGSALASSLGIAVINNVSGLGTAFLRGGWLARVVRACYWLGLRKSRRVFFQNPTDRELFVQLGLVQPSQTGLLPGSGIDLQAFRPPPPPKDPSADEGTSGLVFLLVARLLLDKGVLEFAEAARRVRQRFPQARFQLLGFVDEGNPRGVRRAQLQEWVGKGDIEYLGTTDDVRPFLCAADCVVLPSYREGTSRALLEAAAMGRPIIATDVPGCREVVDDGVSGLLCQPRDAGSLAHAMERFLQLGPDPRARMGEASRALVEARFDEQLVIKAYLSTLLLELTPGLRP
ncbi:MAG: glycosyltransferase family 4 protein [Pseudomonadota bacterium]